MIGAPGSSYISAVNADSENPSGTHHTLRLVEVRRLRVLEEENRKLRQLVADLSLDEQMLQDVLRKKA